MAAQVNRPPCTWLLQVCSRQHQQHHRQPAASRRRHSRALEQQTPALWKSTRSHPQNAMHRSTQSECSSYVRLHEGGWCHMIHNGQPVSQPCKGGRCKVQPPYVGAVCCMACRMWGDVVKWGSNFKTSTPGECCEACLKHVPAGGEPTCNGEQLDQEWEPHSISLPASLTCDSSPEAGTARQRCCLPAASVCDAQKSLVLQVWCAGGGCHCLNHVPASMSRNVPVPAVWVWCGVKELCASQYHECWLKHLVGGGFRVEALQQWFGGCLLRPVTRCSHYTVPKCGARLLSWGQHVRVQGHR